MRAKTVIAIIFILLGFIMVHVFGIGVYIFAKKKQYEPEIKYAEFPFSLTYSLNDQMITVDGIYVCEFKEISWDTGRGFYREWNGYVKETGLENVLIVEDSERQIFCRVGDPRYYMENSENLSWSDKSLSPPHLYIVKKSNNFDPMSVEQIKQRYNIEIISWDFSDPLTLQ